MRLLTGRSLTMAATAATSTRAYDVAIIGGGIAGCAAARSVSLNDPGRASVTVYEIGRGAGGRASTRRTRSIPGLHINHGAPYADIRTVEGKKLVRDLKLAEFFGRHRTIDSLTGIFSLDSNDDDDDHDDDAGVVFVTGSNNGMSNIASSLLTTSTITSTITTASCSINKYKPIKVRYSSMVRSLSRSNSR